MSISRRHRAVIVVRHHPSNLDPAVSPRMSGFRQLITAARDLIFVGILAAPVFGLTWLACRDPGRSTEAEAGIGAGSGVIVREDLVRIWLPGTLFELAERPDGLAGLQTHNELAAFLQARNEQDPWYALTLRGHQVNGGYADRTIIRYPCRDAAQFEELRAVLARVCRNSARGPSMSIPIPRWEKIPNELREREPRNVMAGLLGLSPAPIDRERP